MPTQPTNIGRIRSKPQADPGFSARRILRERLFRTVVLAVPLIVLVGLLPKRPASMIESGISQRQLYEMKYNWGPDFDVLLAGNSRVTVGLAPSEMASSLPGLRIANFGFDGNAFTQEYLSAIESKLRKGSGDKIVVLGITPMTLTERAARQNGFFEETHRSLDERYLARHMPWLLDFFTRFNPRMALMLVRGSATGSEFWRGHQDGWAAQGMEPANLDGQVRFLRANARDRTLPISLPMQGHLFTTVRRWQAAGIATFAFHPPITPDLAQEEARASGFEQTKFISAFIAAGGKWIEINDQKYRTFDGGHLEESSARQLSRDIAAIIAGRLQNKQEILRDHEK